MGFFFFLNNMECQNCGPILDEVSNNCAVLLLPYEEL